MQKHGGLFCALMVHTNVNEERRKPLFYSSSCQAVLYCLKECQKKDWMRKDMKTHSHKHWCKNMKAYMAKHEEIGNLPFTFMSGNVLEMGNFPFTFMSSNVL